MQTQSLPLFLAQTDTAAPAPAPESAPPTVVPEEGTPIQGQPGGAADPSAGQPGAGPGSGGMGMMWILIAGLLVFYVFVMGSQRKEKKKREQLLSAIKKGDRVQTVGGILGTVVEIREGEVVVKVDENNNTRLRFSRSAIQSVLQEKSE